MLCKACFSTNYFHIFHCTQNLSSHQHIVHHRSRSTRFIRNFLGFSFLNHVFTTHSSIAIANSSNISPSVFLVPNPLPPCTFSKPSAKVPTRLLKSPHTTSSSSLLMPDISFLSCAKNSSFSSICLPTWGEYT